MPEKFGIDAAFWVAGVTAAGAGVWPRTGVEAAVANAATKRNCLRCKLMLCFLASLQLQLSDKATPFACAFEGGRDVCTWPIATDANALTLSPLSEHSSHRAHAAAGPLRRSRRIPPRRHRAESQNARAPDTWAATGSTACSVCLRSLMIDQACSHRNRRRSNCLSTDSGLIAAGSEPPKSATPIENRLFRQHRPTSDIAPPATREATRILRFIQPVIGSANGNMGCGAPLFRDQFGLAPENLSTQFSVSSAMSGAIAITPAI